MSNSSGSKTEQPTDKKIRDARQKGQVPQADKFVQIVLAIVGMLLLLYGFRFFKEIIFDIFLLSFDAPFRDFEELTNTLYRHTISLLLFYMVPSISLLAFLTIVASIYGTGLVFSFEGLKPSFGKLNPVKKIKSLFSKKTIYDLFITIIFTIVEGYMVYSILKMHIDDYIYSLYCGIGCFSALFYKTMKSIVIYTIFILLVWLVFDRKTKKVFYIKDLKMTKDETKRESKEMEGDPLIKRERRSFAKEIVEGASMKDIKFVISDGKVSLGFAYSRDEYPVPVLIYKTKDDGAKRLIDIAKSMRRTIVPDGALTRSMAESSKLGQRIDKEFYKAVGRIIAQNNIS